MDKWRNMKRASNCCIVSKHSLLKRLNWEGWWAVLCCQTRVQMTASRATGTHSLQRTVWKALLGGYPEYNWLKIGFAVLFCVVVRAEKAVFHKWSTNVTRNIQDYTTVLLFDEAPACVCLLSINYSGFTALESHRQRQGLHFGRIRGRLKRSASAPTKLTDPVVSRGNVEWKSRGI